MDYLVQAGAAIIPLIIGFLWYGQKTFGPAWMKTIGMTEAKAASGNMALTFGLAFLMAFILTQPLTFFVNHPEAPWGGGASSDTFQHGMLHGGLIGVLFALPMVATKALFEQLSLKYVLINAGYWIITLILMGGVLDYFLPTIGS